MTQLPGCLDKLSSIKHVAGSVCYRKGQKDRSSERALRVELVHVKACQLGRAGLVGQRSRVLAWCFACAASPNQGEFGPTCALPAPCSHQPKCTGGNIRAIISHYSLIFMPVLSNHCHLTVDTKPCCRVAAQSYASRYR